MKKFLFAAFVFSLPIISVAQEKFSYGVHIDLGGNHLRNIDKENFSGQGLSYPQFTYKPSPSLGVGTFLRIPLYKRLGFETGIGYKLNSAKFNFNPYIPIAGRVLEATFKIKHHYLTVPLLLNLALPLGKNKLIFACGANVKYLVAIGDNFDDAAFEDLYIREKRGRHRSHNFSYTGSISYKLENTTKNRIEIGLRYFSDQLAITKGNDGWFSYYGFYNNLKNAKFSEYSLSLKYYL